MSAWARAYWPHVFGSVVALVVGLPAGIASYRHGIEVVRQHSTDPAMAPWLPMTTDGLLLAALVVMWARRLTGRQVGFGPWAAFLLGLAATLATNLGAAKLDPWGIGVALWPPFCLAVVLELVALVVTPDERAPRSSDRSTVAELVAQTNAAAVHEPVTEAVHMTDAGPVHMPAETTVPVPAGGPVRVVDEAVQMPAEMTGPVTDEMTAVVTAEPVEMDRSTPVDEPVQVPGPVTADVPDEMTERDRSDQGERGAAAGQATGPVTDEEVLEWLRGQAEVDRKVPGRAAVIKAWSIGATRADRLRGQVTVPRRLKRVP